MLKCVSFKGYISEINIAWSYCFWDIHNVAEEIEEEEEEVLKCLYTFYMYVYMCKSIIITTFKLGVEEH